MEEDNTEKKKNTKKRKKPELVSSLTSVGVNNLKLRELEEAKKNISSSGNIELVRVNDIEELHLNGKPMHNRISYPVHKLEKLMNNISIIEKKKSGILETGLLNAVMLRRVGDRLERIHGENRIKAFAGLGKEFVPAIILDNVSDELAKYLRISENLEREDLNPYDEVLNLLEYVYVSCGFSELGKVRPFLNKLKNHNAGRASLTSEEIELEVKVREVFEKVGKYDPISFVDRLSVLNLDDRLKKALVEEILDYSHAKEINKLKDNNKIQVFIEKMSIKTLSVTKLREMVKEHNSGTVVEAEISIYKEVGRGFKTITKKKIDSLPIEKKEEAEKKIKELNDLVKEINTLIN